MDCLVRSRSLRIFPGFVDLGRSLFRFIQFLVLAAQAFAERLDALSQFLGDLGDASHAEHKHHDHQHDENFRPTNSSTKHVNLLRN